MGTHGLHAEVEHMGNVGNRSSRAEKTEDLKLAVRETLVRQALGSSLREICGKPLRQVLAQIRASGQNAADRVKQLLGRTLFLNVARRAGADGPRAEDVLLVHAQHQHGEAREFALDVLEDIQPAARSEGKIEDDGVKGTGTQQGQELVGGGRFTADGEASRLGDDLPKPLSHDCVVVGDDDVRHSRVQVHNSGSIEIPRPPRTALVYLLALVVPLLIAKATPELPAVSPFFLWVALAARFFGFGPALAATFSASAVLWEMVMRKDALPENLQIMRAGVFVIAAIVVASLSRQRSKEAREAEERYRGLVDLAPDGIVVTDGSGRIIFANSALAKIVGTDDPANMVGRVAKDFLLPEDHDDAQRRIDQIIAGKPTPWQMGRAIRVDGKMIHVERAGVPLRRGNKMFAQGFIRDLTERFDHESKMEESRRRLQALFDTALDAILFFNSTGEFVDANPAASALLGFAREEIVAKRFDDFLGTERLEDVMTNGRAIGEDSIVRKDGRRREIEYRLVGNVVPGLHVMIVHDITERKEAEGAIRQLSRRLLRSQDEERRRIARQLHDATTQNLTAIRLNLARIVRLASGRAPDLADPLAESMALTDDVISEIRTLSYLLHPPLIDEVGLSGSLKWYAQGFEARSGINVSLDIPDDLQLQRDLETNLFRIIQEALTNIQRHSGSRVARISIARADSEIRLAVADEGKGIPAYLRSDRDAIFAAGVGIAGIRERTRELGGDMQIESTDGGTTITIALPLSEA